MTRFANFAALANHFADQADAFSRDESQTHGYDASFIEQNDLAKLSIVDAPEALDMPDPQMARYAVEMVMTTLFDVVSRHQDGELCSRSCLGLRELVPHGRQAH